MLIVYVDDFKMAGPAEYLAKGWELIRRGIVLDPPEEIGLYLGVSTLRSGGAHGVGWRASKIP